MRKIKSWRNGMNLSASSISEHKNLISFRLPADIWSWFLHKRQYPDRFWKIYRGYLFAFCISNLFIRRGDHRSPAGVQWTPLQNNIKLPYEKSAFASAFFCAHSTEMQLIFNEIVPCTMKSEQARMKSSAYGLRWNQIRRYYPCEAGFLRAAISSHESESSSAIGGFSWKKVPVARFYKRCPTKCEQSEAHTLSRSYATHDSDRREPATACVASDRWLRRPSGWAKKRSKPIGLDLWLPLLGSNQRHHD